VLEIDREALRRLGNKELHQFVYELGLVGEAATPSQVLRAVEAATLDPSHARG
jgi:hypothetical protein